MQKPANFILLVLMSFAGFSACSNELPVTGSKSSLCQALSTELQSMMEQINYRAGTFSISKSGKHFCSNGIGFQLRGKSDPIDPNRKMRIASIDKPITSILIKHLLQKGIISHETRVFEYLEFNILKENGVPRDARVAQITIQNLLDHKLGWDAAHDGLSGASIQRARTQSGEETPSISAVSRYMVTQPLQHKPGEVFVYSNYGYSLLKAAVEKASGKPFVTFAHDYMAKYGVDIIESAPLERRHSTETWYEPEAPVQQFTMSISARDLVSIFSNYWVSGEKRVGDGYDFTFYGAWDGTTSIIRQRPDGYTYAVLLNTRGRIENDEIMRRIDLRLDSLLKK